MRISNNWIGDTCYAVGCPKVFNMQNRCLSNNSVFKENKKNSILGSLTWLYQIRLSDLRIWFRQ
jgi:hypothetical protein